MAFRPRRILDPIHGLIEFGAEDFEVMCWRLIETRQFQRLRRVKQLGFSEFVYPGATHSRFAHSVGVFHTARKLATKITEIRGKREESNRPQMAMAAALVHDLGHGPFSHAFEGVLRTLGLGKHEARSVKLIQSAEIAGGEIVGRTRLQKIGCLLDLAGAGVGFKFTYHLFGPYSEQLTIAASDANALNLIQVEERVAAWGGLYSIYRAPIQNIEGLPESILAIAKTAADADSIELELAVTAAFLAKNGSPNAWDEIASRKKAKATKERLDRAKILYQTLARPDLPNVLPNI